VFKLSVPTVCAELRDRRARNSAGTLGTTQTRDRRAGTARSPQGVGDSGIPRTVQPWGQWNPGYNAALGQQSWGQPSLGAAELETALPEGGVRHPAST
jgi:hypothetical protein